MGTDVDFEVNGESFAAHKLVLAARSPVFRAQLFGPMKDQNTRCINVEDMEAPVFKVITSLFLFPLPWVHDDYYLCRYMIRLIAMTYQSSLKLAKCK